MKTKAKAVAMALFVGTLAAATTAMASDRYMDGKRESGEGAYTIGCSLAGSLGIRSCGELPSGRRFLNPTPKPVPRRTTAPRIIHYGQGGRVQ